MKLDDHSEEEEELFQLVKFFLHYPSEA